MNLRDKIDLLEKDVADLEFELEKANADFHQMSLLRRLARQRIKATSDKITNKLAEIDGLWMLEEEGQV